MPYSFSAIRIRLRWLILLSLFLASFFLLQGCSMGTGSAKPESTSVARVYDKYLSASQLNSVIPDNTPAKDSGKMAQQYIESWISNQVVLKKAESNLENDSVNSEIDKQIDDYRNSLIRFAYEKELVSQRLDTIVPNDEIEKYYNENKDNFQLKDNIIKVIYLKLPRKAPKMNLAKMWYKSETAKDRKALEEYCHQFAENFFLDENAWFLFDDLLKEIPIKTYDKEQFLKNNRFIEIEDSSYVYLVNIKGFKIKDSLSPLVFEKDNIVSILLNIRKLKLIDEMEKSAYKDAQKANEIEIYGKK